MSGFTFFDTLLVFIAIIPILISLYAVRVSKRANEIAEQSDKKMTAIADSQIDEKLAMMAIYREAITITSELLTSALSYSPNSFRKYHGLSQKVWNLDDMHKLHYDFNAVSDLNEYASDEKREELIIYYIIRILSKLIGNALKIYNSPELSSGRTYCSVMRRYQYATALRDMS